MAATAVATLTPIGAAAAAAAVAVGTAADGVGPTGWLGEPCCFLAPGVAALKALVNCCDMAGRDQPDNTF